MDHQRVISPDALRMSIQSRRQPEHPSKAEFDRRVWGGISGSSGTSPPTINRALPGWKEEKAAVERMWALYLETVPSVKEDAERWKGDADGIIIFTGLFSAMVAAFVIESYQSLSPDPQALTTLLLAQISQQLPAAADGLSPTNLQLQSGLSATVDARSIRVNALWACSLCISVTCALFAVMVQQWARRFQRLCDRRPQGGQSSQALARVRLHLSPGAPQVESFIGLLQRCLHVAVILFFAGLVEFFWPINTIVAKVVLSMLVILGTLYISLTVYSFAEPTSLFQTPLTQNIFDILTLYIAVITSVFTGHKTRDNNEHFRRVFFSLGLPSIDEIGSTTSFLGTLFRHGHLGIDDAMTLAVNEKPLGNSEVEALVWLFQAYRAGSLEQLQAGAGTCFVGLCTILNTSILRDGQPSAVAPAAIELATRLYKSPPPDPWTQYFDSWESWLVYVARTCIPSDQASVHFAIMCFRAHWFVLHGAAVDLPTDASSLLVFDSQYTMGNRPSAPLYNTLQLLRGHFSVTVSMAARCLQARIAAGLDVRWARHGPEVSEWNSHLFWDFISVPSTLVQATRVEPNVYGAPQNRALLIIIALVEDILDAGRLRVPNGTTLPPLGRGVVPVLKTIDAIQTYIFESIAHPPLFELVDAFDQYFHELSTSLHLSRPEHLACDNERALLDTLGSLLRRLGRLGGDQSSGPLAPLSPLPHAKLDSV